MWMRTLTVVGVFIRSWLIFLYRGGVDNGVKLVMRWVEIGSKYVLGFISDASLSSRTNTVTESWRRSLLAPIAFRDFGEWARWWSRKDYNIWSWDYAARGWIGIDHTDRTHQKCLKKGLFCKEKCQVLHKGWISQQGQSFGVRCEGAIQISNVTVLWKRQTMSWDV